MTTDIDNARVFTVKEHQEFVKRILDQLILDVKNLESSWFDYSAISRNSVIALIEDAIESIG